MYRVVERAQDCFYKILYDDLREIAKFHLYSSMRSRARGLCGARARARP